MRTFSSLVFASNGSTTPSITMAACTVQLYPGGLVQQYPGTTVSWYNCILVQLYPGTTVPHECFLLWQAEAEFFLCNKAFNIAWGLHGPSVDPVKRHVLTGCMSGQQHDDHTVQRPQFLHCHADKPGRPKVRAGAEPFGPI